MNDNTEDKGQDQKAQNGSLAVSAAQQAAIAQLGQAAVAVTASHARGGGQTLLRLLKGTSSWVFGQENHEVEAGAQLAINPFSLAHGFIAWSEDPKATTRKLGEEMRPITTPRPDISALPNVGATWTEQFAADLKFLTGVDKGLQVSFKSNSLGGKDAVLDIVHKVGERARMGLLDIVPVVTLESSYYQHPLYSRIYKPIFKVVRWMTMEGGGGDGEEPVPEPVTPSPAPTPEAANDQTRRRRTAA